MVEFDEESTAFFEEKCRLLDAHSIKSGVRPPHIALTDSLSKRQSIAVQNLMQKDFSPRSNVKMKKVIVKNCYTGEVFLSLDMDSLL